MPANRRPGSAPPIREVTSAEVERHFPLVHYTLRRMASRRQLAVGVDLEDLEAVGRWAIWEALRRWKPSKGRQSTYVSAYIWGYVMKHQRDMTKADGWHRTEGRLATVLSLDAPIGADADMTLADVVAAQPASGPSDELAHLRDVAARLPHKQRVVAERLLADEPVATAAASKELGVSRQRLGQISRHVRVLLAAARAELAA